MMLLWPFQTGWDESLRKPVRHGSGKFNKSAAGSLAQFVHIHFGAFRKVLIEGDKVDGGAALVKGGLELVHVDTGGAGAAGTDGYHSAFHKVLVAVRVQPVEGGPGTSGTINSGGGDLHMLIG